MWCAVVPTSWGSLTLRRHLLSQFRRPEVQSQGVSRALLPLEAAGKMPLPFQLLVEAAFRGSQLIAPIHASVFLWLFPSASACPLFSEDSVLLDLGPISFLLVTPP